MSPRTVALVAAIALFSAFGAARVSAQTATRKPDYERDIRPILTGRCLKCHGNAKAESGLKLVDRNAAIAKLESGHQAIVPGKPDESELLRRVTSTEDAERMPPEGTPLNPAEVTLLREWIAAGAEWPIHWAYRPLVKTPAPAVRSQAAPQWPANAIDGFILQKLSENKLSPSPPADQRTLLRRVTFDLIGLPPTPEEMAAFLADSSPGAYERVVDRLLASPQYGERWARHWMDVVHYAETHGHDQDRPREHAWPYRDYLIQSFNQDTPFARFVEEQIAGDAIAPDDPAAVVATGFLATGPWDESSLRDIRDDGLDREIARYIDRDDIVTTVMSTFASSTVHCARCHDHKFDPITQQEYYGLQAVFAATDKANRAFDPDPHTTVKRRELAAALAALPERAKVKDASLLAAGLQQEVANWESELARTEKTWRPVDVTEMRSGGGAQLKKLDDGSILAGGPRPDKDTYTVVVRAGQKRITGLRLQLLPDASLPQSGPGRQANGNMHLSELRAWAVSETQPPSLVEIKLSNPKADFNQDAVWSIEKAVDGNPNTAWGIHPEVGKPHQAVFTFADPLVVEAKGSLRIEVQQLHGDGHLIGRFRLSTTDQDAKLWGGQSPLSPRIAAIMATPREKRSDDDRIELTIAYLQSHLSSALAALPPQQLVYCGTNRFDADGSFKPTGSPRPVHLLNRGDVTQPKDEVGPTGLGCVEGLPAKLAIPDPANEAQRRAALARWMTDAKNGPAWRSIVNRLWQYHFGRGIVDTPNDFGRMGGVPSHPELLDWLAVELQQNGGSLKQLQRLIVTSAAYRQSSQHNAKYAEVDADNRLLWRMNRSRLDAESVRDAVLQTAGSLDSKMGGPSVRQFIQMPGVHVTPVVDYVGFDVDDPANCRRSVYRFIFRTLPDPFMEALDCPDSSQLTPQRDTSVTALQALAMLNDKQIVRQSEHLAERISINETDMVRRVATAFRLILGREPTSPESAEVTAYATKHGLANACRFLWNSNEFMFVD